VGNVSGSVTVTSNATNSPATVALSGTGVPPGTQHSVALSWTASSSTDVIGYYVYRGPSSGSLAKLNASPLAPTEYVDSAVTSGQTYYYAVTAVNSSNEESTASNVVSATIPTS
jgi:fibronectin type 3 domain-containing protein